MMTDTRGTIEIGRRSWRRRALRAALPGLVALILGSVVVVDPVQAMDPERAMSQYLRDRWGTERGFPSGPVSAIAQTADGYLWIGTEKGLVRFDGVSFRLFTQASPTAESLAHVLGLITDGEGHLWVRLPGAGLLRYRDGRFESLLAQFTQTEFAVTAMSRGKDGSVLVSMLVNGTHRYTGGRFQSLAPIARLPGSPVIALAEDRDGTVWLGTRDTGLFTLVAGRVSAVTTGVPDRKINALLALDSDDPPSKPRGHPSGNQSRNRSGNSGGDVWIGTDNGVVRWSGATRTVSPVSPSLDRVQALAMAADREANVWVGTASGLARVSARGSRVLARRDGGAVGEGAVTALFEDREGSLWMGGAYGLERLRDSVFVTYGSSEGLPSDTLGPLHVDAEGRTWFAPIGGGLYCLEREKVTRVTAGGVGDDVVYSIAGGPGEIWIGRQRGGLMRVRTSGAALAAEIYTQRDGLAQNSVYAVQRTRDDAVWAGTLSGGVSRVKDGRFTTYTAASGLASNTVSSIEEGGDGTMWFGTPNGASALSNGRWQSYGKRDGLPSDTVQSLLEDATGVLWIGTTEGLAFRREGRIQIPRNLPASLRDPILGLVEDRTGSLWVTTANHVLQVRREALLDGSRLEGGVVEGGVREYGLADGLQGLEGVRRFRSAVADAHGRVWLSLNRGLSVVDPSRLTGAAAVADVPAIVQVQEVSVDGQTIGRPAGEPRVLRLPAGQQRITVGYAGLSLAVPERVRYRYRLDGFDRDWSEPVAAREAMYTNLGPGAYHFRVIASNSEGRWNGAEAGVRFEIAPLFWQTWWFRGALVLAAILLGIAAYRVRMHQVARQLNMRFEERLAERTRIAQDLHDTLLQGFLSASMQLHVAADQVPAESPAKPRIGRVLELMAQVIDEGRHAVRGLRSSSRDGLDLEEAFSRIPQDLVVQDPIGFRVLVEGRSRPLHPLIRDEVYRIGREALVNAFRHAGAKSIEVGLEYAAHHLRIRVRDDGCGIDPQVLRAGREGHWGLPGMRERAEGIGARLTVWSRTGAGTEVDLTVPGHRAFQKPAAALKVE